VSRIDRRRAGQLEDGERLVDDGHGRVVTQYPGPRRDSNAIFDYTHVALELMAIWATASLHEPRQAPRDAHDARCGAPSKKLARRACTRLCQ